MPSQLDTSNIVPKLTHILNQIGDYDDPCFILLHSDDSQTEFYEKIKLLSDELQHYLGPIKHLGDSLYFYSLFMDHEELQQAIKKMKLVWETEPYYISIFRHNPIGNPIKTFKWAVLQLQELENSRDYGLKIAVNDYQDRDNWPGIDKYVAISRKEERDRALFGSQEQNKPEGETPTQQTVTTKILSQIKNWLIGNAKQATPTDTLSNPPQADGWLKAAQHKLNFTPENGLLEVAPFIYSLPQGEVLWYYVLTGEGREQLDATNGLLDLDHILIFHHAKKFAPELCGKMLDTCYGLSTQNELFEDLDEVLDELTDELLDEGEHLAQRQACYLRILDIFYHLFDQQLPEAFYELLVKDEDKACLSQQQYQQRYPIASIAPAQTR